MTTEEATVAAKRPKKAKRARKSGTSNDLPLRAAAKRPEPGRRAATKKRPAQPRGGREQTTAGMLDAAAQLFAERGPHNMTVRDIGARAGVSHALVHRYLGTKEEILAAVLLRSDSRIRARAVGVRSLREASLVMLREDRQSPPSQLRIVANAAMAGVSVQRLAIDFATARLLLELAEREHATAGGAQDDAGSDLPPRLLVAGLFALAIGWAAAEDWLRAVFALDELGDQPVEEGLERLVALLIDAAAASPGNDAADDPSPSPV